MKRFHVHVSVKNLDESIRFYSSVFGLEPTVVKPDYAKWMVEDPRLNFAISQRGSAAGVNHLGIQVDSDEELADLRAAVDAAELPVQDQRNASCCYAKSDKYWLQDPQGIAWETYHTMHEIKTFGGDEADALACCAPASVKAPADSRPGSCCSPGRA